MYRPSTSQGFPIRPSSRVGLSRTRTPTLLARNDYQTQVYNHTATGRRIVAPSKPANTYAYRGSRTPRARRRKRKVTKKKKTKKKENYGLSQTQDGTFMTSVDVCRGDFEQVSLTPGPPIQSTTQPLQQAVILPSEEALEADNLPVVELGRDYTRAAIAERRRPMDNLPSMGMIARDRQDVETDLVKVRNRVKRLKQVKKRTEHHAELNRKKAEQRAEFLLKKHEAKTWLQQQRYVNVVDKRQKTQLKRQLRDNRAASILEYRKEVLLYKQQQTLEYREQVKLASEKLRQEKEAVVLYNRQKKNVVRAGQHMATVRRERKRQVFLETVEQQRKLRIQQAMAGKNSLLDEIALLRAEEIALLKEQQQQQ